MIIIILFLVIALQLLQSVFWVGWSAALGSIIGYVGGRVLKKWQADGHVNFTLSIALAIGAYITGDHVLHVSGVVTTVFTALLMLRTHKETFIDIGRLFNVYWDYLGFITKLSKSCRVASAESTYSATFDSTGCKAEIYTTSYTTSY